MIFKTTEIELYKLPSFKFNEKIEQSNLLLPWKKVNSYNMSDLEDKLKIEGYNPEKYGYITAIYFSLFNTYWVIDGKHRLSILQKIYKKQDKIKIKIC